MGTNTTRLGLLKPSESDFYNQQTEQAENWDKVDEFADDIQKNVDFNLLATLGVEYGGILNNTEAKVAGKAYYDTTGKKIYKCIANTSVNYADAGFFEALSNNDLHKITRRIKKLKTFSESGTYNYDSPPWSVFLAVVTTDAGKINLGNMIVTCGTEGTTSVHNIKNFAFQKAPTYWNVVKTSQEHGELTIYSVI